MKSLARWLATRTPQQLATIIHRRSEAFYGSDPRSLDELAIRLVSPASVSVGLVSLTSAAHQVLTAAARLAAERSAATPRTAQRLTWRDEATIAVDRVLAALGAAQSGPRREAALALLDELQDDVLLWPSGDGVLTVPGAVLEQGPGRRDGGAPGLDRGLMASFNKEPVGIIAEMLGVGRATSSRTVLQAAIVTHLSEPTNVRTLVDSAPDGAREFLERMVDSGALMGTKVFPVDSPYPSGKYVIDVSYVDPSSVWLAVHGLILPAGPERAAVPAEVIRALRHGGLFAFAPRPPQLPSVDVSAALVRGEAQVALTGAVAKVGRLLAALDAQPVAPRKAGGFPVRDTRRLAKLTGLDETETIFWIGLANHAELIHHSAGLTSVVVCPTTAADKWLESPLPSRLALLLRAWLTLSDVLTWWPFADETPIAYGPATDRYAAGLRAATLRALATLPPGTGCVRAGAGLPPGEPLSEQDSRLIALASAARWFAPMAVPDHAQTPPRVWHTVYEAELLGVAAHGALTDVGRALVADDQPALLAALTELLPAERTTARFQADMTVVVAGTPTVSLATLLGSLADRESEGHAVVYRISAPSVRRALDAGAIADELLDQLAAVAEGTLPQPLRYLLTDVGRSHGRARVVSAACCIRCDDEALIAELAKAKGLTNLGLRQIAPTVLISAKPPSETLAALRIAGYAPTLENETGTTVVERSRGRRVTVKRQAPSADAPATALKLAKQLLDRAGTTSAPLWD